MAIERDFEIPQGSQPRVRFQLSVRGVTGGWNVSAASQIRLTVNDENGAPMTPITASPSDPSANWAVGTVTVLIPSSYLLLARRLGYALVVTIGDETVIPVRGSIFVEATPGF